MNSHQKENGLQAREYLQVAKPPGECLCPDSWGECAFNRLARACGPHECVIMITTSGSHKGAYDEQVDLESDPNLCQVPRRTLFTPTSLDSNSSMPQFHHVMAEVLSLNDSKVLN